MSSEMISRVAIAMHRCLESEQLLAIRVSCMQKVYDDEHSSLGTKDAGIIDMAASLCACAGLVLAPVDWLSHEIMDVNDLRFII